MPMFPLGTVLVPGAPLALHVFEPRYQELVRACLEGTPELGVVLIERGSEVGGGDVRFDVGCVARILLAVPLEGGRWALGVVGSRRARVVRWLADAPYPRAEVVDWADPSPSPGGGAVRREALSALRRVLALGAEAGQPAGRAAVALAGVDEDPVVAGYQMTWLAPLGPLDKLALLAAPTPGDRLERLAGLLRDEAAVLARRLQGG